MQLLKTRFRDVSAVCFLVAVLLMLAASGAVIGTQHNSATEAQTERGIVAACWLGAASAVLCLAGCCLGVDDGSKPVTWRV